MPTIEISKHKQALRHAILTSSHWDNKPSRLTNSALKHVAVSSLVIAIFVLGVIAISSNKSNGSAVHAKELAQKTYQAVSKLPAEQQTKVSNTLGFDSRTALQEAYNAKDLKSLTYEEFATKSHPLPPDPDGKLKKLKFLEYTNKDGANIIIGIDPSTNLPLFGSISYTVSQNPTENKKDLPNSPESGVTHCTIENGEIICRSTAE